MLRIALQMNAETAAALAALDEFVKGDRTPEDSPEYDSARIHFAECVLNQLASE